MTLVKRYGLVALAAVLVALGAVGWWRSFDLRSAADTGNAALIDEQATADVQAQVGQALTQVLTYNYEDPESTEKAAKRALSGDAREEYDTLFAALRERAPDQQLVLTAQVQVIGVKELDDDSAELVVFLDQSSRRAADDEASVSAAQLAVDASKTGDTWKITGLTPL
jgi:Mce-associated membrane protein